MKMLGLMVAAKDDAGVTPFVIAAGDDIWFVPVETFPPDFDAERESIEKLGTMVVIGAICGRSDA